MAASNAVVGTYNNVVKYMFNKTCNYIITKVLKLPYTSTLINGVLKNIKLQFPINSKESLRIRFSSDPKVIDQTHFQLKLFADFIPTPPTTPAAGPIDTSAANKALDQDVQTALLNDITKSS